MKLPWALPWACTLYFPAAGFCKYWPFPRDICTCYPPSSFMFIAVLSMTVVWLHCHSFQSNWPCHMYIAAESGQTFTILLWSCLCTHTGQIHIPHLYVRMCIHNDTLLCVPWTYCRRQLRWVQIMEDSVPQHVQLAQHHMSLCNDGAATSYTYVRQVRAMVHDDGSCTCYPSSSFMFIAVLGMTVVYMASLSQLSVKLALSRVHKVADTEERGKSFTSLLWPSLCTHTAAQVTITADQVQELIA